MYHFMASNRDVRSAAKETSDASEKQTLLLSSLQPSLRMMYHFFREIIDNHKGQANQAEESMYFMHIIAGSYSSEHAHREITSGNIVTLKGWRFTGLCWPKDAKAKELDGKSLRLLHNTLFKSVGDEDWKKNGSDSLNFLAHSAANAIKDLLDITYITKTTPI